ncbi:DUF1566 domain-containing protein [Pseudomonas sp. DTU_2021_1001937_2_SI_NGA_ILE_001]|uniref:DUF1566 domain-containing protein n=1 Tax=Pseudomonas sp. DTU_2021_1001937_2_SI_NGA_ILE_001 TaxID=3077589 RepID=UPI0028FC2046|nr:DUF1566 domain-containing protein [Pseudomonas sp. DTU_2021_1001937_2_SI_NGA_ILE_001]WNW09963.1 DUF1566 domain-containing protein [Pseudomonas sp. DTU_2021_1001937_2_SI_NGA_ILE_001]
MNNSIIPPAIGQVWPGQGGIYAGIAPARNGNAAYHLIIADSDIDSLEWGPYDDESSATSLIDGLANTQALLESGPTHPAAQAAAAYAADGHTDFYLPAAAELYEAWLNLDDRPWGWTWSSSQRTTSSALCLNFADGTQSLSGKSYARSVRPVRKVPIQ